jgi:hypothetical protein
MIDTEKLRYRILQTNRGKSVAVGEVITGATAARRRAEEMQREYDAQHPGESTWTKDLFILELVNGDKILAALQRQRMLRSARLAGIYAPDCAT